MFCTKLTVTHQSDPTWHTRYLTDVNARLTTYVNNISQSRDLDLNYSVVYNRYISENKLLYRVKAHFPESQSIVVLNVWESEQAYDVFHSQVNGNAYFEIFTTANLNYTLEKTDDINIEELIDETSSWNNHLVQYIHPMYNTNRNLTVGDPLKSN
jgi:hypothetical protein